MLILKNGQERIIGKLSNKPKLYRKKFSIDMAIFLKLGLISLLISLDAADGDDDFISEITDFWNNHLPIIMSVGNGYEYYAIEIDSGVIVFGFEPEFEEAETVADTFEEFLEKLMNNEL